VIHDKPRALTSLKDFLATRDPGLRATRRAGRAAIFVPLLLWVGEELLDSAALGTFAALGSMAMLVFVDFDGPLSERAIAQATLVLAGAVLICLGTLVSTITWAATVATLVLACVVLFAGILSSSLAGATNVLLISFVLPVTLPGSTEVIPDRLLGWLLAGGVSVLAVGLLWPAPTREPLRTLATQACRRFAAQLRAEANCVYEQLDPASLESLQRLRKESTDAATALRSEFFATPYRPAGLSTASRALVRITDALIWLDRVFARAPLSESAVANGAAVCELTTAAAELLEHGAGLLLTIDGEPRLLDHDLQRLHRAREGLERAITSGAIVEDDPRGGGSETDTVGLVSSLQPSFRAQEISFIVAAIAQNIQFGAAAQQRSWWQRLLGRQPGERGSAWSSIKQRAAAHLESHSVWLHNSLRGGVALSLAVLVAELSNVQHGFWVVFGTLAVLRSNALSTGQDAIRALSGTVLGILVGGGLVALVGANNVASWFLLVPAVVLAALGPATISFAAGQMGFTTTLLVLNNIVAPAGWSVGLIRFEDVAIGCGVSIAVGALFWPRGAARALGWALAEGFSAGARYLRAAVEYGASRCDSQTLSFAKPQAEMELAAAAGRRVDDAFRAYIAEHGKKALPVGDLATLVGGVSLLRLNADAVIDLWERDERASGGDRTAARQELRGASASLSEWYEQVARALVGRGPVPSRLSGDDRADARLVEVVRRDLHDADGQVTATAVKLIWTADHIDAARRLQGEIAEPGAHVATLQGEHRAAGEQSWH
jgi:Fusaric acid resistance protein-like